MSACHCSANREAHDTDDHVRRIIENRGYESAEEEADARMQAHKACHRLGRKKPLFRPECTECQAMGDDDE